jgi:hypothetical protein
MPKHQWNDEDRRVFLKMQKVGIKKLTPKEKARMNRIFTEETGLP